VSVRVGVIGTGIMGADHARTLHRYVSGADVTLVADLDLARAQSVAESVGAGARAVDDPYALIDDSDVDVVVIASHDSTHAEFALAAVDAGKPVMCEKPLAPSVSECARVVEAEAKTGRTLVSVGFMRRFDPGYVELRSAIRARSFGDPVVVHCVSRGVSSGPGTTSEMSVTQSAIHEFDIVPWLLGSPIVEVSWHAARKTSQADEQLRDPQVMLLRTADGVLTTVEVFLNARYGYDIRCEVVGEAGAVSIAEPVRLVTDLDLRHATAYARDWRPRFAEAYRLELQSWIDAIAGGGASTLASAQDGLVATAVAEAVIESMHDGGRPVQVARA
jgi:myo-inositol 2-dehydrogenase/D-chiro-inositol 1-dehydrogenase